MIHYLILSHNKLDQLELLVNKLKTPNSEIYIHLDKRIKNFKKIENVHYISNRQRIFWGGFSMVKAELIGFGEIFKHMKKGDHVVLISGQCYPIKPISYIEKYIRNLGNMSSMSYRPEDYKTRRRIVRYYFNDIDFHVHKKINQAIISFVSIFKNIDKTNKIPPINLVIEAITNLCLPKRKYLCKNYNIYTGSQWMVLSFNHIEWILKFCETNDGKRFFHHFKMTSCSDEIFFQTMLLNHKKEEIYNNCLWYMIWEKDASSPNILKIKDLENIKKSDKYFARKFDIDADAHIIQELDTI